MSVTTVSVRYIVDDVDAAIAFYCQHLGFREEMHPAPTFAAVSRGDLRLLLSAPSGRGGGGQAMPDGTMPEPGGWNRISSRSPGSPRWSRHCEDQGAGHAGRAGRRLADQPLLRTGPTAVTGRWRHWRERCPQPVAPLGRLQCMRPIGRRGTSGRSIPPITAAVLGIATLAACGSLPTHTDPAHATHTTGSHPTPAPTGTADRLAARLEVLSATFVSARTGWALGVQPCQHAGCTRLELRMTTDRGRHWLPVPAPLAGVATVGGRSAADAVSSVRFADAKDGWAFTPGLWATHDGGRTWHQVDIHGRAVESLEAAGGLAIAALTPCADGTRAGCGRFAVYSTPVATDRWRAIPGASGAGAPGASEPAVTISDGTGYVTDATASQGEPGPVVILAGPASGASRWQPLANPCRRGWGYWGAPLAAGPDGTLVLGCAGQPGAGQQLKHAYFSPDGGHTWRRLTDPPSSGYLSGASVTPAGTIVLSGGRSDVYLSWDGGRTWHTSPSLNQAARLAGAGFSLDAAMTTSTQGFAIQEGSIYGRQMWFTYDAGHTWVPVTLH